MSNPDAASRFDEIYKSTKNTALAYITAKCKRLDDISDVFQDTYMELYQVLLKRGVDYVTNDKALVMRIVKRKIAKYYSLMERLRNQVPMTALNEDGEEVELSDLEPEAFLTEDFAVNKVLLDTVRQYIRQKPDDVQRVFYLFYYVGLTIPEISKSLGISESNVKNKIYRTIGELRDLLK